MAIMIRPLAPALPLLVLACSTSTKPCTGTSPLVGLPEIRGDMKCQQKRLPDGSYVNDGAFKVFHPDGKTVAVEGQFADGKMNGVWFLYDESGKKTAEKTYRDGVEILGPQPARPGS